MGWVELGVGGGWVGAVDLGGKRAASILITDMLACLRDVAPGVHGWQLFEVLDDMQKVYQERAVEVEAEREDQLAMQLAEEVSFHDMLRTRASSVFLFLGPPLGTAP